MQRQDATRPGFCADRSGASAAEYAMILAIVGTAIALASFSLGQAIGIGINKVAVCISSAGGSCT